MSCPGDDNFALRKRMQWNVYGIAVLAVRRKHDASHQHNDSRRVVLST